MANNYDRFPKKSFRLLYLWLTKQLNPAYRYTDYMNDTGIDMSGASRDLKHDLPQLDTMIEEEFPDLKRILNLLFRPSSLIGLPILETKVGDQAHMTVNITLDYKTGEMTWEPFVQTYCKDGEEVGQVKIFGGSSTFSKG